MASRVLSRRLLLLHRRSTPPSSSSLSLLFHPRYLSAKAEALDTNLDAAASVTKSEQLSPMLSIFEDMIHGMIVQRCEPDWLPFVPGSSFWVPPRPKSGSFIKEIEKLSVVNRTLSDEETMAVASMRGWPSSSFFIHGNEADVKKSSTRDKDTDVHVADSSEDKND